MKIPFVSFSVGIAILRIMVGVIFLVHGSYRTYNGTVGGFGEYLGSKGFPLGVVIAWGITIFEMLGGILLIADRFTRLIACVLIVHMTMAILIFHLPNGWFAVGGGTGGMEFPLLIIAACFAIASNDDRQS